MKAIWKYHFNIDDDFTFDLMMPENAVIIAIQTQGGMPCLWAIINTENIKTKRLFKIFGTGHEIKSELTPMELKHHHIGTFQTADGHWIWHLFEVTYANIK